MIATAGPDFGELVPWVKAHSRVSALALRRRFRLSADEAWEIIAELVNLRVLSLQPEGESYRVRYSQRTRKGCGLAPQKWFNPQGNPDRRHTPLQTITEIVRTTERGELAVREAAEATA